MVLSRKAAEASGTGPRQAPLAALPVAALPYREPWALDFEFRAPDGERPEPLCLVARELRSGRELRLWRDQLAPGPAPLRAAVPARPRRAFRRILLRRRARLLPAPRLADAGAHPRPVRRVPGGHQRP